MQKNKYFLSVAEVSKRTGICKEYVYNALQKGSLKGIQMKKRGKWRISTDNFQAWLLRDCPIQGEERGTSEK